MNKKIRPIIKWTGGKYDEFALFADHIPQFERYIEPFFGGGGVFFALQPNVPSFINDKSADLIQFYQQIGKTNFKKELLNYADAWDQLGLLANQLWPSASETYLAYLNNQLDFNALVQFYGEIIINSLANHPLLSEQKFIVDEALFLKTVVASMADKVRRIKRISEKESKFFTPTEHQSHFETGIKGGTYLFFRSILNQCYQKQLKLTQAKTVANWYFVREFCYGAMFRFNAAGDFNIPYGGIAYNKKNFRLKVENIFESHLVALFKHTKIYNLDFEAFLNQLNLTETDFIFLDPPYDSEFSEYDQSVFSREDQQRLANCLKSTVAKWMVVIKETPFIREIYTQSGINILTFDKNYTYNVRGRNSRGVTHLIITNY